VRVFKTIVMVCVCSMAVAPPVWSTTLSLGTPSAASPGSNVLLPLSLSSSGSLVSGAEWTISYSSADFVAANLTAGPAATSATKNLECNSISAGSYACILTGLNQNAMSDGVVANLVLTLSSTTLATSSTVSVTEPSSSDPNGNTLATAASGSTVMVAQPGMTLSELSCSPASITVPNSSTCTVTLQGAAPNTGTTVALGYVGSGATMSVPSSVTVPAGASQTTFAAQAVNATSNAAVTISATLNGVSSTFALTVSPAAGPGLSGVSCSPANITVPNSSTGEGCGLCARGRVLCGRWAGNR
jgi:Cohesin domain